ncbi:NADH/ubiquinone/plastoquinone (complex I) [Rhodovulum sp. 12E13]|uniref:complex I subunit 5 family protein n=1 Tax=Rhodovulum sp. 12E13 TaxID=2203891 RepID=UPI000E175B1C|nr:proton-conducting transporter membrane subunit [Rhodovulum sp. 12E13]RDC71323.1 NADH/ubiquinone/plastoquinone (complex I) [Rhodovulum sp. 12E13]
MTPWIGPFLPLAALIWPLLLGALTAMPPLRPVAVRLLPLAPVPALWLALAGGQGVTAAPDLLLGVTLELDDARRLLLGMTAALWLVAALAAQPMTGRPHTAIFSGFWCLVLAGNLGVFLALDVVTFYVSFAAVSLASWFLIVHERTEKALHAGRVYIVIALAGEVALLVGLIIGADAAQSMAVGEIRAALGAPGSSAVGIALLVLGFGIKAGLVPLHVWLPLAHPAAPVPGSAVLSGAIVKAGLFGLVLFVPEGALGPVLMPLGLVGAFGAALWGLTQANPKAVLAYSTISQMGLMIMLVGAGGAARETVPFFALHHGLAKGALFLLVGVMMAASGRGRRLLCLALAAAVSASVAGLPLTGGALAKAAVKQGLADWSALALSLSSVATSLILIWFLARLWQMQGRDEALWGARFALPAALGVLAVTGPWLLWSAWSGHGPDYLFKADTLIDALWPVAIALPPAAAVLRWRLPQLPPGDLLLILGAWRGRAVRIPAPLSLRADADGALRAARRNSARLEGILIRWRLTGVLIPLLVLLMFALLP